MPHAYSRVDYFISVTSSLFFHSSNGSFGLDVHSRGARRPNETPRAEASDPPAKTRGSGATVILVAVAAACHPPFSRPSLLQGCSCFPFPCECARVTARYWSAGLATTPAWKDRSLPSTNESLPGGERDPESESYAIPSLWKATMKRSCGWWRRRVLRSRWVLCSW
jgi:hypothetical protein